MAERKAVNKYYPPEWTPAKGSINKFRGTHALRERARKLHMGILIIRFEMPYNIWCGGCENHIGMGVRYNAEKTKVGMYYSTPIYKFRMKCHLCTNHFEIQTDPQNLDYVILNGARRQERRWDPTQNEQVVPEDKEVSKKLALDSMYRLEHGVEDKVKQKALAPSVAQLEEYKERWRDDYMLNKALRQKFREKKSILKATEEKDADLLRRSGLSLNLLPECDSDSTIAGLIKLTPTMSFIERQKLKREEIISRPIFSTTESKSKSLETVASPEKSKLVNIITQAKIKAITKPLTATQLGILTKNTKMDTPLSEKLCDMDISQKNGSTNNSLVSNNYDSASSDNDSSEFFT